MKLYSTHFGNGTVISKDANNVTIDFNGTVKTLVIKFANLTNEDGSIFGTQAIAAPKKSKKLNRANFMTEEEFGKSDAAKMTESEWEAYRDAKKWGSVS